MDALRRAAEVVETLIGNMSLFGRRMDELMKHGERKDKTYPLQYAEMSRQLTHRKNQIETKKKQIEEAMRYIGSPAQLTLVHVSSFDEDVDLQWHLHCLGFPWARTVFEYTFEGMPLLIKEPEEEFAKWVSEQKKKVQELAPSSNMKDAGAVGGGGAGGDGVEINAQQKVEQWKRHGQDAIKGLSALGNVGAESTPASFDHSRRAEQDAGSRDARQQEVAHEEREISSVRASTVFVEMGRSESAVWFWIISYVQRAISRVNRSGSLYSGREKRQTAREAADPTMSALILEHAGRRDVSGSSTVSLNHLESNLQDDIMKNVNKVIEAMLTSTRVRRVTDIRDNGDTVNVRHNGDNQGLPSRSEAMDEADREANDSLVCKPEGMSVEDFYLANQFLMGLYAQVEQGKFEKLGPGLRQLLDAARQYQDLAVALSQRCAQADAREVRKVKQAYKELMMKLRDLAVKYGDKVDLGEEYKQAFTNYRSATAKLVKMVQKGLDDAASAASTVMTGIKAVGSWIWSYIPNAATNLVTSTARCTQEYLQEAWNAAQAVFETAKKKIAGWMSTQGWNVMQEVATRLWGRTVAFTSALWASRLGRLIQWVAACFTTIVVGLTFGVLAILRGIVSFLTCLLPEFIRLHLIYHWRGRADIRRFAAWGNSEAYNGANPFLLVDLESNPGGISEQRFQRRAALQSVWQSGCLQWWLDPALQLNLDTSRGANSLDANRGANEQHRQQRAHQEYLRDRHEHVARWSWRFAVVATIFTALIVATSVLVALYSGGVAAVLSFKILVEFVGLLANTAMLGVQWMMQRIERDSSLTQEQKQDWQSKLTIVQSVLLVACLLLAPVEYMAAGAVGAAVKSPAIVMRFQNLMRKVTQLFRFSPRSLLLQVDRLLGAFGINGAAVSQFGLNSWSKFWAFVIESGMTLITLKSMLTQFLSLSQSRTQQQNREDRQEQREETQDGSAQQSTKTTNHKYKNEDDSNVTVTKTRIKIRAKQKKTKRRRQYKAMKMLRQTPSRPCTPTKETAIVFRYGLTLRERCRRAKT